MAASKLTGELLQQSRALEATVFDSLTTEDVNYKWFVALSECEGEVSDILWLESKADGRVFVDLPSRVSKLLKGRATFATWLAELKVAEGVIILCGGVEVEIVQRLRRLKVAVMQQAEVAGESRTIAVLLLQKSMTSDVEALFARRGNVARARRDWSLAFGKRIDGTDSLPVECWLDRHNKDLPTDLQEHLRHDPSPLRSSGERAFLKKALGKVKMCTGSEEALHERLAVWKNRQTDLTQPSLDSMSNFTREVYYRTIFALDAHRLGLFGTTGASLRSSPRLLLYRDSIFAPRQDNTWMAELAKLAESSGVAVVHANLSQYYSSYVGESERGLRGLFAGLSNSKSKSLTGIVLVLEGLELVAGRDGEPDHLRRSMLTSLLLLLDGIDTRGSVGTPLAVIGVVGCRPQDLEESLTRPGRFDTWLPLGNSV